MKLLRLFSTALVALTVFACGLTSLAGERCRDCTFPMKIGENQWLMPDTNVVVHIFEQQKLDSSFQMTVSLVDPQTNALLATGTTRRTRTQRSVTITLIDPNGYRIDGQIVWVDFTKGMIQARFECATGGACSLDRHH